MWGQAVQYLDEMPAQKVSLPVMMRPYSSLQFLHLSASVASPQALQLQGRHA